MATQALFSEFFYTGHSEVDRGEAAILCLNYGDKGDEFLESVLNEARIFS